MGMVRVSLLQHPRRRRARRKNNIGLTGDDLLCKSLKRVHIVSTPAEVDAQVAALVPTQLLQRLQERRDLRLTVRIGGGHVHEHTYAPYALALLRARREWPRCCAAEHRDELAPSHARHGDSLPPSTDYRTLSLPPRKPVGPWGQVLNCSEIQQQARSPSPVRTARLWLPHESPLIGVPSRRDTERLHGSWRT